MSNQYYISSGLAPIDSSSGATSNSYYTSSGLMPLDSVENVNIASDPILISLSNLGVYNFNVPSDPITVTLSQIGSHVAGGVWSDVSIDIQVSLNPNSVVGSLFSADPINVSLVPLADVLFQLYNISDPINIPLTQVGSFVAGGVWSDVSIDVPVLLNTSAKIVAQVYIKADPINISVGVFYGKILKNIGSDFSWIGDNKDQGSWSFTEQSDKWGYLNNPNWTGEDGVSNFVEKVGLSNAVDLSNKHRPCGHWHKQKVANYGPFSGGRFVAATGQYNTPYIYVYDIGLRQVVKIDTSISGCPIVDTLTVCESPYVIDYLDFYFNFQRGPWCINKDGEKLWYLFRSGTDMNLVEVDVSKPKMELVKSTVFSDLLSASTVQITDGCSNDTFTFWSTNEKGGRIFKFRNSDHTLVENHYFNFPYTAVAEDEPINSLDVHKGDSKLYWGYVRDASGEVPSLISRVYFIKSDLDFNIEESRTWANNGLNSPLWLYLIRVFGDNVYFNLSYHPFYGHFHRVDKSDLSTIVVREDGEIVFPRNFFQNKNGMIYMLRTQPVIGANATLRLFMDSDLGLEKSQDVEYYTRTGAYYYSHLGWLQTLTSAMADTTGVIMIFRYEDIAVQGASKTVNRGAAFDSNFSLLSDTEYTRVLKNENYDVTDEPVVWPAEEDDWESGVENWDGQTQYG